MLPTRSRSENAMASTPIQQVPTSYNDLSSFHRTSFKMGDLVPFMHEMLLPGTRVNCSVEAQIRTPALFLPIMEQLEVHTAYFFVRYTAIYDKWRSVVKPNWQAGVAEERIPKLKFTYLSSSPASETDVWMSTLQSYFGIPVPIATPVVDIEMEVNALPFAAYYKIYNDFYRDSIVQPEFGYNELIDELTEEPLIRNLGFGNDDWTSDWEDYILNFQQENNNPNIYALAGRFFPFKRNWSPDYFTAATYEPQYGENILIPLVSPSAEINGISVPGPTQWLTAGGATAAGDLEQQNVSAIGQTGTVLGASPTTGRYLNLQQTAGTLRDLSFASAMQTYLERINRAGDRYRDQIREFYGTDPGDTGDYAVYIGSNTSIIPIGDVWQTAGTTERVQNDVDADGSLGAYAGRAVGFHQTQGYQFRAPDFGHLIGIINVQPRSSYHQGLSKLWTMDTWEDIPQAQFAHIGDEEILERELLLRMDLGFDHENQLRTWGYVPRYSWMRYRNSNISGELRKYYTQFHLSRNFPEAEAPPPLSGAFLATFDIEADRVMKITGEGSHEIYAWIWSKCEVITPLPKYSVPML